MYYFIINPVAGKGRALKKFQQIQESSDFPIDRSNVYMTKGIGDARSYIASLIDSDEVTKVKMFIVIGGDGTMHEVMNGLDGTNIPIYYIKGGSGNDFSRGLAGLEGNLVSYYPGRFDLDGEQEKFVNCIGFGFDALVAKLANESSLKGFFNRIGLGRIVYVIALIRALLTYKPQPMKLQIDDKSYEFDRVLFAVVNNHPYFGGGMKINPMAVHDAKDLFVIVVENIPKWKVLLLFITVFFGRHTRFKGVRAYRGKEIQVLSPDPILFQTDGEIGQMTKVNIYKTGEHVSIHKRWESKEG